MNRVDQLPDNRLIASLESLERDLAEIKPSPQRVGSQSILSRVMSSSNAYDWSGVLPTSPTAGSPFGIKYIEVIAEATRMENLFGELFVYMYVGSPSNWYRPSQYLTDIAAGLVPPWSASISDYPSDVSDLKTKRWQIYLSGDNSTTVYLKFFIVVSDITT